MTLTFPYDPRIQFGYFKARTLRKGHAVDVTGRICAPIERRADDKVANKLSKVRGVAAVEEDPPVDIGPPGSSETW